jgi:KDO2-lipid IV(A) lauroyltransferase
MTLPARLVQQTGAVLLFVWGERLTRGRGYHVHVQRFEGELSREPAEAAAQINAEMERMVRAGPTQYLWGYARYKQPREEAAA